MPLTEQLLLAQNECTIIWNLADGSATGAVVSYVWYDGAIWMTALAGSNRVAALRKEPRAAVVVSGKGSSLGHARSLTMRGECYIRDEAAVRDWFFPAFAHAVLPHSKKGQEAMAAAMATPDNLVLQFVPFKRIPYDAHEAMIAADAM